MIQNKSMGSWGWNFPWCISNRSITLSQHWPSEHPGRDFLGELRPLFQLFQLQVRIHVSTFGVCGVKGSSDSWVSWVSRCSFVHGSSLVIHHFFWRPYQPVLTKSLPLCLRQRWHDSQSSHWFRQGVIFHGWQKVQYFQRWKIMVRYAAESGYCFNVN